MDDKGSGQLHGVRFYEDSHSLCRLVATFLGEGLRREEPALVIARPTHTATIEACLRAEGVDPGPLKERGGFLTLDATETLATFMTDGVPNPGAFGHHVGGIMRKMSCGLPKRTVRAYGEMVDVLWQAGMAEAAIRVETLWNELAVTRSFRLLCGYSIGQFYKGSAIGAKP